MLKQFVDDFDVGKISRQRFAFTTAFQKNKKHGVEHGNFDVQLDQYSQAVNRFSKVHRFG